MFARSALEIATSVTSVVPSGPVDDIVLCVVYSYDSDGVRTPERPTRKLIPRRGATARPVPSLSMYAAPTPMPTKPNSSRLNGRWNDGSTRADHTVDDSPPALTFCTERMPDSSKLSTRNQPIDGEKSMSRRFDAIVRPAEPPSSST